MLPLNEKLKALREEKGLSQEELAIKLNVVRQTVSKWEKGLSTPDAEMLIQLAAVYDTTVGAIMGEEPPQADGDSGEKPAASKRADRGLTVLSVVLLVIGSPMWVPLVLVAAAVVLAAYIVIWVCVVSLWAVFVSVAASAVAGVAAGAVLIFGGSGLKGLALIGAGLFCAGFSILLFFGCKAVTAGVLWLTKKTLLYIRSRFTKKEEAK